MSARANQLLEAGLWLKMSGDLDGARRLFEQALKLDPDSIRARELLGHSVPEVEAMPQELRDVPLARTDLFSVPLPRLFQDEPPAPASVPEEWWNAPPSDVMGNTARFFVRPAEAAPSRTIPWGPSPLPPPQAPNPATADDEDDFQGDDLGKSGEDFGLELSELAEPEVAAPVLQLGEGSAPSPTTGPIPLPPALAPAAQGPEQRAGRGPAGMSPVPGPLPAPPPPVARAEPSRTTGAIPLPPAMTPLHGTPAPRAGALATPGRPRAEPSGTPGPVPLPGAAVPRTTPTPAAAPTPPPRMTPAGAASPVPPRPTSTGPVPMPGAGGRQTPAGLDPSPAQEPVPWAMPAPPAFTPSSGLGAIPLPPRGGTVLQPPRSPAPPPAQPPVATFAAHDAWGEEGDGPTLLAPEGPADALELLAEPHTISGLTPLPAPRDPRSEAVRLFERSRELQNLDDHSGARELLLQAQALYPELTGLADALSRSEAKLQTIYESKIGRLNAIPRVRLKEDEVIWLNLDHRAGFMLAQIDGSLSFEDLFSVSGMTRLDTARILAQLLDQRVIVS